MCMRSISHDLRVIVSRSLGEDARMVRDQCRTQNGKVQMLNFDRDRFVKIQSGAVAIARNVRVLMRDLLDGGLRLDRAHAVEEAAEGDDGLGSCTVQ